MKTLLVHRAVALAFLGEPLSDEQSCVAHFDGDPGNNHVSNLRWASYEENWEDRRRHGTGGLGMQNGRSKLTPEKVDKLKAMYDRGDCTFTEVGQAFGISQSQANKIYNGQHW